MMLKDSLICRETPFSCAVFMFSQLTRWVRYRSSVTSWSLPLKQVNESLKSPGSNHKAASEMEKKSRVEDVICCERTLQGQKSQTHQCLQRNRNPTADRDIIKCFWICSNRFGEEARMGAQASGHIVYIYNKKVNHVYNCIEKYDIRITVYSIVLFEI